jgi:hypothetical protein
MSDAAADSKELLWQEREWRLCAKDPAYFLNEYGTMWAKEGGATIDWTLWDCQREALASWDAHRLSINLKTRQLGFSWLACGYSDHKLIFTENAHVYFQSIGQREVTEQVNRMVFIYNNLPDWMKARVEMGGRGRKQNDSLIEFSNGSALHAVATTKRAGHGAAPTLYILDEFARNEQDLHTWRAVKPALAAKGQVIVISTSNGKGNQYHSLWTDAVGGKNQLHPLFFPASSHPDYTPEFLAREKDDYAGDEVGYYEAYPATPEEAFMSSSRCPFDQNRIQESLKHISKLGIKPEVGRLVENAKGVVEFEPDPKGSYFIWKHPLVGGKGKDGAALPKHLYAVGADVAEGLVNGDWSVALVLDDDTGEVVAMYRNRIKPEFYARQLALLGNYYGEAYIAVEVNFSSDFIVDDLKEHYSNLYTRERRERIFDLPTLEVGFRTTASTRPRIITQLRRYFGSTEKPLLIYSPLILNEMAVFEEDDKGKLQAAKGKFDDTVMALAIAIESASTMPKFRKTDYVPKHRRLGSASL